MGTHDLFQWNPVTERKQTSINYSSFLNSFSSLPGFINDKSLSVLYWWRFLIMGFNANQRTLQHTNSSHTSLHWVGFNWLNWKHFYLNKYVVWVSNVLKPLFSFLFQTTVMFHLCKKKTQKTTVMICSSFGLAEFVIMGQWDWVVQKDCMGSWELTLICPTVLHSMGTKWMVRTWGLIDDAHFWRQEKAPWTQHKFELSKWGTEFPCGNCGRN